MLTYCTICFRLHQKTGAEIKYYLVYVCPLKLCNRQYYSQKTLILIDIAELDKRSPDLTTINKAYFLCGHTKDMRYIEEDCCSEL